MQFSNYNLATSAPLCQSECDDSDIARDCFTGVTGRAVCTVMVRMWG